MNLYAVSVAYPGKKPLTYSSQVVLDVGQMVEVPLGKRSEIGCVLSSASAYEGKIKEISSVIDGWKISPLMFRIYQWMADYYHYPLGLLVSDCEPHFMKRPRPMKSIKGEGRKILDLNFEQKIIFENIKEDLGNFKRHLIHGITGSGKTLIYLHLIQEVLNTQKSILLLIPEINLTPQLIQFFSEQLAVDIYTYHSELSDSEKFQIWQLARNAEKPALFIGVRSSIFMPIENLGLIIVDEEHDSSYKQDDRCAYNAKDVAIKKAQFSNIPIVLGSATPSVESYYLFHQKNMTEHYHVLKKRANESRLPTLSLVDAREKNGDGENWPVADSSIESIKEALRKGEQVLVFLNRLGFAQYVQCRSCGQQFNCPNCSVVLRYFKRKNILGCQHCDYKLPFPNECTSCGNITLLQKGFGTEKVEEVLKNIFPEKKIERFDRDVIKNFQQLEDVLGKFQSGKIDILIGTQMVSKGHNFPNVKTVIVLGIDQQMNFPDFRSQERTYQLLTQVAGRAGRFSQDGKVIIQTLNPDHPIFSWVNKTDWEDFYNTEIEIRKMTDTAPFSRLVLWHFSSRFQDRLIHFLHNEFGPMAKSLIQKHFPKVVLLGPRPAFIEKRVNQFSWNILFKSSDINQLHNLLRSLEESISLPSGLNSKIDIDPYQVL